MDTGFVMHELEHDAAETGLCERSAIVRVNLLRSKKFDAALLEQRYRCRYIRCPEADTLQVFLDGSITCIAVGFDQLEEKAATGTLQEQTLGHDAETDAIGKWCKAEELRIEPYPVCGPVGADVLNDTEKVQVAYRGRLLIVMPEGLGTYQLGHPSGSQRHALASLKVEPGANGLAATAITAVERLAATRGITLHAPRLAARSKRTSGDRLRLGLIAAAALVLVAALLPLVRMRRRRR